MDRHWLPRVGGNSLLSYGSAAVVAVAALLKFQEHATDYFGSETHCFKSVRTNWQDLPVANCFTVSPKGIITSVYASDHGSSKAGSHSGSETTNEGYVIPGLWDGHGHLLQYGEFLHSVDLFGTTSLDEARARVRDYVEKNPQAGSKTEWIRGVGWDQMAYGQMPTADDLSTDDTLKNLYIALDRVDVHCVWVSQAVLDLLPDSIPDVPGGEIVRDPGMGVFCDNAMDIAMSLWPKPSDEKKSTYIKSAMTSLNGLGIVGMHDAGVTPNNLDLYRTLASGQDWTVRVYAMVECYKRNTFCAHDVERHVRPDGRLSIQSVKLFADGALGSWGSAMIEPYSDRPDTSGSLLVNATELTYLTTVWAQKGFQVNIHAIGDLANRYAVDAMTVALRILCPDLSQPLSACQAQHRFRIEHSQIIHPSDQDRIHALGIIPSIQPTHATSDMAYAELRLGHERTATEAYRMRSLLDLNPVLGSDFPVEPADPFQGLYAAITRKSPHAGKSPDGFPNGWYAEETLTLDQAIRGFTLGPAYGGFMEQKAGVLQPGAFADWVVIDKPLEELGSVEELRAFKVRETWVGGKRVYKRD
ncbi:amidohydrolase 3 [Microdochium bolleyi]|uniref:Amidohydrolase 3 n=1 Tax=Microdochium bolleyi TaxID=196109 RepID=A0A136J158_9PEZI|nr:amidohydrolase 3 [Microdochium bolleyi]